LRVEREQVERLQALRKKRNANKAEQGLKAIEDAVLHKKNIMEPLIEALESYVTLGEISDLLRKHFGEYREASIV
jgi:methylmalonyl-CoA mutase, N-terminal domain